jgi:hypothetical protein
VHAAAPPAPASAGASPAVPRVAKIWVSRDGSIELNGARVEIGAVESELAAFAGRGGVVVYGRDDPDEPPPAVGMRVIELVVEHQLPIRLTVKRDFSDAEDAGGGVQEWGASGPSAAP